MMRADTMTQTAATKVWTLGIPDDEFFQRKPLAGLITKCEVRVVALSKLCIRPDSVVWDIGAGSGSVGIEAAMLAPRGRVFAIEKNTEDSEIIQQNIFKFSMLNVLAIQGNAPDGTEAWPDPDAIFVGGSGGRMAAIVATAAQRLRPHGRIVIDAATIENLYESVRLLKEHGFAVNITLVQVSRSKPILDLTRFVALNPVYVITGSRDAKVAAEE